MSEIPFPSIPILEEAEETARVSLTECIRKTLQEAFLQALQRRLHVLDDSIVHVSANDLEGCLHFVGRLAAAWSESLKQEKYHVAAEWVSQCHELGKSSLWSETANGRIGTGEEDKTAPGVPHVSDASNNERTSFQIPYCELRSIGKRRRLDDPMVPSSEALRRLQELTDGGATYWPLETEIVEKAVQDISKRMRFEKSDPIPYQVVPKSVWEQKQKQCQQSEGDDVDEDACDGENGKAVTGSPVPMSNEVLVTNLLQRKKKNAPRGKRRQYTQEKVRSNHLRSRQPSELSRGSFDVHHDLTTIEKKELDRFLHDEMENDGELQNTEPVHTAFGGLRKIGRLRHYLQPSPGATDNDANESKQRRLERVAIKERLFPHKAEKNTDPSNYRSRIVRTENGSRPDEKSFQFDMGWSLLEVESEGSKRYYCFSGVEVTLEDKDLVQQNEEVVECE